MYVSKFMFIHLAVKPFVWKGGRNSPAHNVPMDHEP